MMEFFKKVIHDPTFASVAVKDEKQKKNLRNHLINLKSVSDGHK